MITGRDLSLIRLEPEAAEVRDDAALAGGPAPECPDAAVVGPDDVVGVPGRT